MDIANLAPDLARLLGINPATLVLLLWIIVQAANVGARLIPNDATGYLGVLRKICALIGLYVSSRITSGVTVNDTAKAVIETPVTARQVEVDGAKGKVP